MNGMAELLRFDDFEITIQPMLTRDVFVSKGHKNPSFARAK
jgi:hypothetical protein